MRRCRRRCPLDQWSELLEDTGLLPPEANAVRARLVPAAKALRRHVRHLTIAFFAAKAAVSAGALLIPSLVSLYQFLPCEELEANFKLVGWITWAVGLGTSLCSAGVSLSGVDKSYFTLRDRLQQLETELWLFLGLAGRYRRTRSRTGHRAFLAEFLERCEGHLGKATRAELTAQAQTTPSEEELPPMPQAKSEPGPTASQAWEAQRSASPP